MSNHYGFFYSECNSMFDAKQGTALMSSIYIDNFRLAIALYGVRTLPKHTWINDPNTYIAPNKDDKINE